MFNFQDTYTQLPDVFYRRVSPTPVRAPQLALWNEKLALELGIESHGRSEVELAHTFSGNTLIPGSQPLAQAYAGHQFGHFTMLGDGRALLLGEHVSRSGERYDIQLKGSGPTPYSRRGDGRAALKPMLREYLMGEAMHALGIPTTRSLAVVLTGETVYRDTVLPGAVLTRVANSHIRVGTFEYAAALNDLSALKALATYTLARHAPQPLGPQPPKINEFFDDVMKRQARLIAQWMSVGFIHGVMNTDNMALSGETLDYGPCAFMDVYDPATVFSSIDREGRYAYGNQARIAHWNLARLAEAMLPLFNDIPEHAVAQARDLLDQFPSYYTQEWLTHMGAKIGLLHVEGSDRGLIEDLLTWMHTNNQDYTNTFLTLMDHFGHEACPLPALEPWWGRWQTTWARFAREAMSECMRRSNPRIIPRNYHVETALEAASTGDIVAFQAYLSALSDPYSDEPREAKWLDPGPSDANYQTFCGT